MKVYTQVSIPSGVYMISGRVDRAEAIAEVRRSYEEQRARCERFLSLRDDEIAVHIVRGKYAGHIVEELTP